MKNWRIEVSSDVAQLARALRERMPILEFAIWDLTPFRYSFHDLRRNIIVVECDKVAHEEIVKFLAQNVKWKNWVIYAGDKKPIALNKNWIVREEKKSKELEFETGVIAIINRTDFKEADKFEEDIYVPWIERQVVDLLAFAYRKWLPITSREAIDALTWAIKEPDFVKISKLHRYATRRYVNWLLSLLLYKLVQNKEIAKEKVDFRYIEGGKNAVCMIDMVQGNAP